MSQILGKRRAEAQATNPQYSMSFFHRVFGSAKYVALPHLVRIVQLTPTPSSSTLLTIFGGRVDDLRTVLLEERLPEDWESRVRKPFGLTMLAFNFTVLPVELGIRVKDWAQGAKRAAAASGDAAEVA